MIIPEELAKKLKDAGFIEPLKARVYSRIYLFNKIGRCWVLGDREDLRIEQGKFFKSKYDLENYLYIPTLSELVRACGEKFQLTKWKDSWTASEEIYYDDAGYQDRIGQGSTPEEAVANLWLELNKKI